MNDFQKRILGEMTQALQKCIKDESTLDPTIYSLEGMLDIMEMKDKTFVDKWYELWIPLEIRNSIDTIPSDVKSYLGKDLNTMKVFLEQYLAKHSL